jgi:outer membrane protein OmpA-like peptidoglycan-associated protein
MRLEKVVLLAALSLTTAVRAEDNVMVDLSALDNLGVPQYVGVSEPLFPVLPKKTVTRQKAAQKTTSAKNKAISKNKNVKAEVETVALENKTEAASEPKVVDKEKVESLPVVQVVAEPLEDIKVVDVEPVADTVVQQAKEAATTESGNIAEDVKTTADNLPTEALEQMVQPATEAAETVSQPQQPEVASEALLVSDTAQQQPMDNATSLVPQVLHFEDDVSDLTSEQMAQLNEIVGHFKNEPTNKIAIYSYNVEDGGDSFRKKRLSLNRAVGIRSYLLKQGYKNFSIKVVNVDSDSSKENTVELEEI